MDAGREPVLRLRHRPARRAATAAPPSIGVFHPIRGEGEAAGDLDGGNRQHRRLGHNESGGARVSDCRLRPQETHAHTGVHGFRWGAESVALGWGYDAGREDRACQDTDAQRQFWGGAWLLDGGN